MDRCLLLAAESFDGARFHHSPRTLLLDNDRIEAILPGDSTTDATHLPEKYRRAETAVRRVPFVMPGLVEGHCHLFLDGDETAFDVRAAHLKKPFEELLATGRQSLELNLAAGITACRDAGDVHGVNNALREELSADPGASPTLLAAGVALRKAKRYGSFLAREAQGLDDLPGLLETLLPQADQLKIMLTGIIDFETGTMKGGVQFTLEEATLIQQTAARAGKLTFCHCSGVEGLQVAVGAGFNCIEHGFFMTRDILAAMRDQQIVWVPTFMPVDFQWRYPEYCGWNQATVDELRKILDNHDEHLRLAYELGVPVVAGSDAGSYGSPQGRALIEDLVLMRRTGAAAAQVLESATSLPRRLWGLPAADLAPGIEANLLCLAESPERQITAVRRPVAVYHRGWRHELSEPTTREALLVRN
ncbi:MAG: amidohydrolase family protein [Fimbriimonadaceae bacterium]|nr:amidohydrolase family protein [Fimbriimonadaceae bacterium]